MNRKKVFNYNVSLTKFISYCDNITWNLINEDNMALKNKKVTNMKKMMMRAYYLMYRLNFLSENNPDIVTNKFILSQFSKMFYSHEIGFLESSRSFSDKFLDRLEDHFKQKDEIKTTKYTKTHTNTYQLQSQPQPYIYEDYPSVEQLSLF